MKPIHLIALTMGITTIARAELPVIEIIDATSPSREEPAIANTPNGKVSVILRTFGTDKIQAARTYGALMKHGYSRQDLDAILWNKGLEIYNGDKFQAKAFKQYAESGYGG